MVIHKRLIKEERGKHLSHTVLSALFQFMDDSFSLSCLFPAPWGDEDRQRHEKDPLRAEKIQKVARVFAQVGF